MAKSRQRLEYGRLAEALAERGLVDSRALQDALSFSARGGPPFPEALVTANLVADWELSRIVAELYGLPFITVDFAEPDPKALVGLDNHFLVQHGIVPLSRHGKVLTVLMPSLSTSDTLEHLARSAAVAILPIVGTVRSNRTWLDSKLATQPDPSPAAALPSTEEEGDGAWSSLFDEADAAVLLDLKPISPEDQANGV